MTTAHHKTYVLALASITVLGMDPAAQAQAPVALSLGSPIATAVQGDTLTFTLNMTGGTNVGTYTTRVSIDGNYLSFIGASPFTETFSGFDTKLQDSVNSGALDISYGTFGTNVDNVGTVTLGTFQVKLLSALPVGGTFLTLAAPSGAASADPSSVLVGDTGVNELTTVTGASVMPTPAAAPEPTTGLTTLVGAAALGILAVRRRMTFPR